MAADILGISGSPIPNSNTDRAVKAILYSTGSSTEFIKLGDYRLEPCRACLACASNNRCVVQDDGPVLAEKFRQARAFVIGGYTSYSSLDARTKSFMERMYCLRHNTGLNRVKIGVSVVTSAMTPGTEGLPPAAETAISQLMFWMMEEGMANLGSLVVLGNPPCIRCGYGDTCELSGIKMLQGPQATVASVGVKTFEGNSTLVEAAKKLGRQIREALDKNR